VHYSNSILVIHIQHRGNGGLPNVDDTRINIIERFQNSAVLCLEQLYELNNSEIHVQVHIYAQ